MEQQNNLAFSQLVCRTRPIARALLQGSSVFPEVKGAVWFYPADQGTLVAVEVFSLPTGSGFFGFHLHEGDSCAMGTGDMPFPRAGSHLNPAEQPHPNHAGDFPVLLSDSGYAYLSFYTARITPQQAIGRTVIVHRKADDYRTQPSGISGTMIACGEVRAVMEDI